MMNKSFKISVIIPMYNSEKTICAAISSVYAQTYIGFIEIVVINDGSTDKSLDIVENLQTQYLGIENKKLKLISKQNGGVSSARNVGIREASYEIIALLDSDDKWLPDKLSRQIKEIENDPTIHFIGCNYDKEIYPWWGKSKLRIYNLTLKQVLWKSWPNTSTVVFKKEIIGKIGFYDEMMRGAEDFDFYIRIAKCNPIYILNESLVIRDKAAFGESGLSSNMRVMYDGEVRILKKLSQSKSLNYLETLFFYSWFSIKYVRRLIIVYYRKNYKKHYG